MGINSLLPGTFIFSSTSFIISTDIFSLIATQIAANALYTLNLPGIPIFILSFLPYIFSLKSAYLFVIVMSFATLSEKLSTP